MTEPQSPSPSERATSRRTVVAVYAHPDDGEFFAAGTLAKWARRGDRVYAVCCTDGALGSKVRGASPGDVAIARAKELAAAMRTLGGEPPVLLGFPDGRLREHGDALYERLVYWLRKLRADVVITFDPWKTYEIHPDHIEAGRRASEAATFSCFPNLFPSHQAEGLDAVQPAEVWYMGPTERRPNRVVDVSETLEVKTASLLCHGSQMEMLADWFVPGADPRALTDEQRGQLKSGAAGFVAKMAASAARLAPGVAKAEAFYALEVGPGHFDNYGEMYDEALGIAAEVVVG
jgi:LmbE family N-acetylglucosaminyl deacetylase